MTAMQGHFVVACLFGAAGVALLAAGSHAGNTLSATAGQMLLFHAPALLAAALAREVGAIHAGIGRFAMAILASGTALFAGELTYRGFSGAKAFVYAAPLGGLLIISGWLGLALATLMRREPG